MRKGQCCHEARPGGPKGVPAEPGAGRGRAGRGGAGKEGVGVPGCAGKGRFQAGQGPVRTSRAASAASGGRGPMPSPSPAYPSPSAPPPRWDEDEEEEDDDEEEEEEEEGRGAGGHASSFLYATVSACRVSWRRRCGGGEVRARLEGGGISRQAYLRGRGERLALWGYRHHTFPGRQCDQTGGHLRGRGGGCIWGIWVRKGVVYG